MSVEKATPTRYLLWPRFPPGWALCSRCSCGCAHSCLEHSSPASDSVFTVVLTLSETDERCFTYSSVKYGRSSGSRSPMLWSTFFVTISKVQTMRSFFLRACISSGMSETHEMPSMACLSTFGSSLGSVSLSCSASTNVLPKILLALSNFLRRYSKRSLHSFSS